MYLFPQAVLPVSRSAITNTIYLLLLLCLLGLFTVPTQIIFVVAPVNALLNYALGSAPLYMCTSYILTVLLVWGPEPIRLGFIGAPIASAISNTLVTLISIVYGVYYVPRTAWHPLSRRMFTNLGVLAKLGISGIGEPHEQPKMSILFI